MNKKGSTKLKQKPYLRRRKKLNQSNLFLSMKSQGKKLKKKAIKNFKTKELEIKRTRTKFDIKII